MSRVRHFLRDDDLSPADQGLVLDAAARLAEAPHLASEALRSDAIGLLFEKPSLRTRVSSEVACARLGATPVHLRTDELQLSRGESAEDSVRVLVGYLSLLMARVREHGFLEDLARPDVLPIVNGLSDRFHPLQSLADLLTLRQELGTLAGRRMAFVGDGNNVASSLMLASAMAGLGLVVATPEAYRPPEDVVDRAIELAAASGAEVRLTTDPVDAVKEADAVYTDVWTSMGQEDEEAQRRRDLWPYQVNAELIAQAPASAIVLHCLPAHRGDEITDDVLDSERSRVFGQAHNRLPATAALFLFLLEPSLAGRLEEVAWDGDPP